MLFLDPCFDKLFGFRVKGKKREKKDRGRAVQNFEYASGVTHALLKAYLSNAPSPLYGKLEVMMSSV
jgi:hypothetical protein